MGFDLFPFPLLFFWGWGSGADGCDVTCFIGFGVRCSQYVFEIARCAGIHDLSARATRSRNPMNVIKATMHALRNQKLPETIARGRGKKFVDVRKVYYNGMV